MTISRLNVPSIMATFGISITRPQTFRVGTKSSDWRGLWNPPTERTPPDFFVAGIELIAFRRFDAPQHGISPMTRAAA
jgi:hypothetical protein